MHTILLTSQSKVSREYKWSLAVAEGSKTRLFYISGVYAYKYQNVFFNKKQKWQSCCLSFYLLYNNVSLEKHALIICWYLTVLYFIAFGSFIHLNFYVNKAYWIKKMEFVCKQVSERETM